MKSLRNIVATVALLLAPGGMAFAQQTSWQHIDGQHGEIRGLSQQDHQFVIQAAQANRAEIQLARLGLQRGQSQDVKELSQRMLKDHTQASRQLYSLAKEQGISLPNDVSADQKAVYKRLSGLYGIGFDRAFLREMDKAHTQAIALFRDEVNAGDNQSLRSFAQATLPTLRMHLQMAQAGRSRFY